MTWLTLAEYLCHRWPWLCSVSGSHYLVLRSSLMSYHRICNKSKTTSATSGTGTAYPSEFTSGILWGSSWYMFSFYVVFGTILFVLSVSFTYAIVLSVFDLWLLVFSNFPMYMVIIRLNEVWNVSTATTN